MKDSTQFQGFMLTKKLKGFHQIKKIQTNKPVQVIVCKMGINYAEKKYSPRQVTWNVKQIVNHIDLGSSIK